MGVFTQPDFYRLTNMHVFRHQGRQTIAAMGFPDEVFLIDAADMCYLGRIKVQEPGGPGARRDGRALIGTMAPSPDGTKLFVQTTRSFQVVDLASGRPKYVRDWGRHHSCANHMLASRETGPDGSPGRGGA